MKKTILILAFLMLSINATDLLKRDTNLLAKGKAVMFIFDSKTCSYCDLLKKDFSTNKQMQNLAKNFNIYLINKDTEKNFLVGEKQKKETTTTLRMAFSVKTTPNIIMFDKNWNKIFQLPGYANPKQMIVFMKFVKGINEKTFKVTNWQKYLKDNGI